MSNSQHYPSKDKPWFCWNGDEFEYFATELEAKEKAESDINYCLDEVWSEEVENIIVGKATLTTQKVNVEARPDDSALDEDMCDLDGYYWPENITHRCGYEPLPMTNKELSNDASK
ncbi:hypothetical protein [Vibrio sp. 10N.261.46.A3]|uniref:hypothetical protein n=1 Tax=Vibrio sp. 10N.261.46.A3 TaxID=3229658 RepID=UPI003551B599